MDSDLKSGDVVLIQQGGYGFLDEDESKYVELVEYKEDGYFCSPGWIIREYDYTLETTSRGCGGYIGVRSFGNNPLVLFNVNDEDCVVDSVNSPKHYAVFDGTEAIEIIANSLTQEEFRGYCFGNLLKYRLRCGKKDDVTQELNKADKYKELYENYKHLCRNKDD